MTILNPISNLQKAALGRNESDFNPADSGSTRRQNSKFNPRESIYKNEYIWIIWIQANEKQALQSSDPDLRPTRHRQGKPDIDIKIWESEFTCFHVVTALKKQIKLRIQSSLNRGNHAARRVQDLSLFGIRFPSIFKGLRTFLYVFYKNIQSRKLT